MRLKEDWSPRLCGLNWSVNKLNGKEKSTVKRQAEDVWGKVTQKPGKTKVRTAKH